MKLNYYLIGHDVRQTWPWPAFSDGWPALPENR